MHSIKHALMSAKGYAKGGIVREEDEAVELARAVLAKVRPVAENQDEMLTDEYQTELSSQHMPDDPYREIEGEGEEREKMKRRGMIEFALEKARNPK